jgi:GntR family transcriptional regulator
VIAVLVPFRTFVSTGPFQYRVNNLWSFAQQMHEQGRALTTRLVSFSIAPLEVPDAEVRSCLAVDLKSAIYLLERLRLVDGRPVLFQRSYLPVEIGRLQPADQLDGSSLYDLLAEVEQEVVRAVETIRAVVPDEPDAANLNLAPGTAAMLSIRLSLSEGERPVLLDRALISGDACEVTAERSTQQTPISYILR